MSKKATRFGLTKEKFDELSKKTITEVMGRAETKDLFGIVAVMTLYLFDIRIKPDGQQELLSTLHNQVALELYELGAIRKEEREKKEAKGETEL